MNSEEMYVYVNYSKSISYYFNPSSYVLFKQIKFYRYLCRKKICENVKTLLQRNDITSFNE